MAKICIRILDWVVVKPGELKVFYKTWDCKCICTLQNQSGIIKTDKSPEQLDKKDIHLEVLKQLYP